jgi:hypothetical protein
MSWPAVSKELLAAKYARVTPRFRTAWPLCWPQTVAYDLSAAAVSCRGEKRPRGFKERPRGFK